MIFLIIIMIIILIIVDLIFLKIIIFDKDKLNLSVIREAYMYLFAFTCVIGLMLFYLKYV